MLRRIIDLVVHTEDDGDIFILGGGGDYDFFHRAAEMFFGIVGVGEAAGGFKDDLGSDGFPGKLGWVFLGKNLNAFAIDRDAVGAGGDFVVQVAENGIVLQQVSQSFGVGKIVDGHDFDVGIVEGSAKYVASNASKAVNAYFNCHVASE